MTTEEIAAFFEQIEAWKKANPWYMRSLEIMEHYNKIVDALNPKPTYVIVTGDSTLPFYQDANGNWYQRPADTEAQSNG